MSRRVTKIVAGFVSFSMVATPALAKSADSLQDLIGAKGAGGETELQARGFEHVETKKDATASHSFWWNASKKDCIEVVTIDGRYSSIADVSNSECGQKSSNGTAVAAAAIGAVALGALLLSRKDKDKHQQEYNQDWQEVEVYNLQTGTLRIFRDPSKDSRQRGTVGAGTILRNYGCDMYGGESWCEVSTMNGRTRGWARDRYLRATTSRPGYGSGYNSPAQYSDLNGARASSADSSLRQRGFRNVDGFKSGYTAYTVWYRSSSRQCVQMTVADGRVQDIRDIRTHPKCH